MAQTRDEFIQYYADKYERVCADPESTETARFMAGLALAGAPGVYDAVEAMNAGHAFVKSLGTANQYNDEHDD